jgi:hypothetical protein
VSGDAGRFAEISRHAISSKIVRRDPMRIHFIGLSVFGAIALVGAVLAVAIGWLVLTSPITVANAVNEGDVTPFIRDLAQVLLTALEGLLKYL